MPNRISFQPLCPSTDKAKRAQRQREYDHARDDYVELCLARGMVPPQVPRPIPSHAVKASRLRLGGVASGFLAILVFTILCVLTIDASWQIVVLGSVIFAVLIGHLATCALSSLVKVNIYDPDSAKAANTVLVASGFLATGSFAMFLALRFWESSAARSSLSMLATIFELALLFFFAAARELLPFYAWSGELAGICGDAQADIEALSNRIETIENYSTVEDENDRATNHHSNTDNPGNALGPLGARRNSKKPNGSADNPHID